jgi:serine phosphatase RsbU (regulator of sigma subunit)
MAERVHQELLQASDATRFVTLFLGLLDPRAHRLEYVNAGHNAPLLFTEALDPRALDATGLPLGMIPGARYETGSCELPPGALLCVYSDGVTEAAREDEMFGDARLVESMRARRAQPLDEVADGLLADLAAFLEGRPAGDDVTLLLLRREG